MNAPLPPDAARVVEAILRQRHSVRAFQSRSVAEADLRAILEGAARAPSGTNLQPWRVHVVRGAMRERVVAKVCGLYDAALGLPAEQRADEAEYRYYPAEFFGVYQERRRKVGFDLYALLGIAKGDKLGMALQHRRNFELFGAPIGLFFTIDRRMSQGSWLDYGMFLQSIMLLAKAYGLDTCPQAAWIHYQRTLGELLGFAAEEQFLCGMALGYADENAPENRLHTERAGFAEYVVLHD